MRSKTFEIGDVPATPRHRVRLEVSAWMSQQGNRIGTRIRLRLDDGRTFLKLVSGDLYDVAQEGVDPYAMHLLATWKEFQDPNYRKAHGWVLVRSSETKAFGTARTAREPVEANGVTLKEALDALELCLERVDAETTRTGSDYTRHIARQARGLLIRAGRKG